MKRAASLAGLFVLNLAVGVLPQAREKPKRRTAEQERLELKPEWNRADLGDDPAAVDRIPAHYHIPTDGNGEVFNKDQCRAFYGSSEGEILAWVTDDIKVRVYGNEVVVTMRAAIKEEHTGKENGGAARITNTWIRKAGRCQCVATHISRITKKQPSRPPGVRQPAAGGCVPFMTLSPSAFPLLSLT